jgi:hypothetical protein
VCRSGGTAPPFLILALDGDEWSASRPRRFTPGERAPVPLDRRLGGRQSQSGRCGVQEISCPCHESNPGLPARSPSLSQLTEMMYSPFLPQRIFVCRHAQAHRRISKWRCEIFIQNCALQMLQLMKHRTPDRVWKLRYVNVLCIKVKNTLLYLSWAYIMFLLAENCSKERPYPLTGNAYHSIWFSLRYGSLVFERRD